MRRFLCAVGAALVLTIGSATPAVARGDVRRHFGPPVYLALGDSVAAGVGAQPYVTGYPEQAGALLEHGYNPAANKATPHAAVDFDTKNIAVAGATTADLDALVLDLIERHRHHRDPFNNVEVVTVTIGGNDIFSPAVNSCIVTAMPADCQPTIDAALAAVQTNLVNILGQLTAAAGRRTEVLITTYYNPIGSCFLAQVNLAAPQIADVVLEGGEFPGLLRLKAGLNDVIREAAAATGAQVADLYGKLGPAQFVGGTDCLHPNLAGHTTIAGIVYDTVAR
jgi:lysophospholipase L1-like esterase